MEAATAARTLQAQRERAATTARSLATARVPLELADTMADLEKEYGWTPKAFPVQLGSTDAHSLDRFRRNAARHLQDSRGGDAVAAKWERQLEGIAQVLDTALTPPADDEDEDGEEDGARSPRVEHRRKAE